jgi:hypothetical protein
LGGVEGASGELIGVRFPASVIAACFADTLRLVMVDRKLRMDWRSGRVPSPDLGTTEVAVVRARWMREGDLASLLDVPVSEATAERVRIGVECEDGVLLVVDCPSKRNIRVLVDPVRCGVYDFLGGGMVCWITCWSKRRAQSITIVGASFCVDILDKRGRRGSPPQPTEMWWLRMVGYVSSEKSTCWFLGIETATRSFQPPPAKDDKVKHSSGYNSHSRVPDHSY